MSSEYLLCVAQVKILYLVDGRGSHPVKNLKEENSLLNFWLNRKRMIFYFLVLVFIVQFRKDKTNKTGLLRLEKIFFCSSVNSFCYFPL